jgi:thiol-disulfide isomerase/thioredoxin
MNIKPLILIILSMIISLKVNAQLRTDTITPLRIGQKIPDLFIENLVNYPKESIKISEFKGKALILDFWTFTCTSCIQSWPKLLQLQEQFQDKLSFLLINTKEDGDKIIPFLREREKILKIKMNLPVVFNEPILKQYFPHVSVPHLVFIDKNGIIKAITYSWDVHPKIIQQLIDGKDLDIPEKTDINYKFDYRKPLYVNGNGGTEDTGGKVVWSTIIKEFKPSILSVNKFGSKAEYSYGVLTNVSVKHMIMLLYGVIDNEIHLDVPFPVSRVAFRTDSTKLVSVLDGVRQRKYDYTIQITAKKRIPIEDIKRKMLSELEEYFGIKITWEKQIKTCLILSRNNFPLKLYNDGDFKFHPTTLSLEFNNITIKKLFERLSLFSPTYAYFSYPIIDETNYDGKLGKVKISGDISDWTVLRKELSKYGIQFSLQDREVDILVIGNRE